MSEPDHGLGIGAKPGGIESSDGVHEANRDATGGDIPGGGPIFVERHGELERVGCRIEGGHCRRLHPAAGGSSCQVEHPHTGGVDVELAAIGGHRLHDAESQLRLIGELAGMDLFSAGLRPSMKSVDAAVPISDLGLVHTAEGRAKGIADRHAEQCAEELVLCCVWHLHHPNPERASSHR